MYTKATIASLALIATSGYVSAEPIPVFSLPSVSYTPINFSMDTDFFHAQISSLLHNPSFSAQVSAAAATASAIFKTNPGLLSSLQAEYNPLASASKTAGGVPTNLFATGAAAPTAAAPAATGAAAAPAATAPAAAPAAAPASKPNSSSNMKPALGLALAGVVACAALF
ncbi:hypothetical protein GQ54DRAFT_298047 [Martensiomyces pterosporus]|nr:hypothetical protein GQ54DRAFT_298047 [Martensiomyces pterosporus]